MCACVCVRVKEDTHMHSPLTCAGCPVFAALCEATSCCQSDNMYTYLHMCVYTYTCVPSACGCQRRYTYTRWPCLRRQSDNMYTHMNIYVGVYTYTCVRVCVRVKDDTHIHAALTCAGCPVFAALCEATSCCQSDNICTHVSTYMWVYIYRCVCEILNCIALPAPAAQYSQPCAKPPADPTLPPATAVPSPSPIAPGEVRAARTGPSAVQRRCGRRPVYQKIGDKTLSYGGY